MWNSTSNSTTPTYTVPEFVPYPNETIVARFNGHQCGSIRMLKVGSSIDVRVLVLSLNILSLRVRCTPYPKLDMSDILEVSITSLLLCEKYPYIKKSEQ